MGQYKVALDLHPDVETSITVIVARSEAEAERIARGEDVTVRRTDAEEEAAAALANAETFFEEGAGKAADEGEAAAEGGDKAEAAPAEEKPAKAKKAKKAKKKDEEA